MISLQTEEERLANSAQTKLFFGDVSDMWLHRRLVDPASNFPRPIMIGKRRYWKIGDLRQWRDAQPRKAAAA
jgi:predicted DNA-binding transcriptional regulator AlpA